MSARPKSRLVPFEVPWMVSPSHSQIRLEVDEEGEVTVAFNVFFRAERSPPQRLLLRSAGAVVRYSPIELWRPAEFERSALDAQLTVRQDGTIADPDRYSREFDRVWEETGLCPSPSAHEILNSGWSSDFPAHYRQRLRHIAIVGHDGFAELLCERWSLQATFVP